MDFLKEKFCIDSRKVEKGCIFVAIKGERFDGHDFVPEALEKGAKLAVVERPLGTGKEIVVESVIDFLIELASRKLRAKTVIGITGSSGKTFTKDLVADILPDSFRSPGNMNTEIGLPLSILNEYEGQKFAVLEMGVSKRGDLERLCKIRKPDVGVVLNVGRQHLGFFESEEELFEEKTKIFECSRMIVYNADDERMREKVEILKKPVKGFGKNNGECKLVDWRYSSGNTEVVYEVESSAVYLKLFDIYHMGHLLNVAAALCVLRILDLPLDPEEIIRPKKEKGRFNVFEKKGVIFIDDTYNASLLSFKMAIDAMERMEGRRIAIVGPILEQGSFSKETHERLSKILEKIEGVFVLDGYEGSEYIDPSNVIGRSDSKEELAEMVSRYLRDGDIALFKASRGVKMEEVLERVIGWI